MEGAGGVSWAAQWLTPGTVQEGRPPPGPSGLTGLGHGAGRPGSAGAHRGPRVLSGREGRPRCISEPWASLPACATQGPGSDTPRHSPRPGHSGTDAKPCGPQSKDLGLWGSRAARSGPGAAARAGRGEEGQRRVTGRERDSLEPWKEGAAISTAGSWGHVVILGESAAPADVRREVGTHLPGPWAPGQTPPDSCRSHSQTTSLGHSPGSELSVCLGSSTERGWEPGGRGPGSRAGDPALSPGRRAA